MSYKTDKRVVNASTSNYLIYGRKKITTYCELEKYKIGSLISYTTLDGRYSKGGFVVKIKYDYFIFITLDFSKKYRVRYNNIDTMWVGDVYCVEHDYISFKCSDKATNFPIIIGDVVVKYVNDNYAKKKYMATERYKTMVKWYEIFGKDKDKLVTQNQPVDKRLKLGVVGSRHYNDYTTFKKYIGDFVKKYGEIDLIISGGCSGVDKMAERYAGENDIELKVHEAEWAKYGKKAGPLRNQLIVNDSNYLLAFPSDDSVGTYSSIHFGNQKGIKVVVHHV